MGERVHLSPEEAAHARARRLVPGAPVTLVDGSGWAASGRLTRLDRGGAEVEVEAILPAAETGPQIALGVAAVRRERLSWIVEKATELGVFRISIVSSERTQAFRTSPDLVPRLTRVAREAAKQCESARWPSIEPPRALAEFLSEDRGRIRFLLDPAGDPFPIRIDSEPTALLVGPEGGWAPAEIQSARALGWSVVALPVGKLRAETAAIAAVVLARAALLRPASRV